MDYSFNINGDYLYLDKPVENPSTFCKITVFDKTYIFDRYWLGLIAHYEVNLPFNELFKIFFVECDSKVLSINCGKLMVFLTSINVDNDFRVIPGFTRYCINRNGVVKSIKSNKILKENTADYGYPYVNLYDPDKAFGDKWRSVSIHILIARAFILNSEPDVRFFVNHKNGNKQDYNPSNLEWTTSSENNIHAVDNDLRKDNIPCLVRNIKDNQIKEYSSISLALKSIGCKKKQPLTRNINGVDIPSMFLGTYEIKRKDDLREWFYNDSVFKQNILQGPYEVLKISTGEIFECQTLASIVLKTNVTEDRIRHALRSIIPLNYDGYYFRVKSEKVMPEFFKDVLNCKPRSFSVCNDKNIIQVFNSVSEITKRLPIDKKTLKKHLLSKKPFKGFRITEMLSKSPIC